MAEEAELHWDAIEERIVKKERLHLSIVVCALEGRIVDVLCSLEWCAWVGD